MLTALLTLTLTQLPTANDFLDNSESGDAFQSVQLRSHGVYEGTSIDKAKGNTVTTGKWSIKDDTLEVKVSGCKGPLCKEQKKDWTAKVSVVAPRAMLLDSTAPRPLLQSGAYYCHYLGCEPRIGTEILSKSANLKSLHAVEDHLIGKNRGRDATVVYIGQRPDSDTAKSRVELCGRDLEKAKKGLELLKADLADAPWFGEYTVVEAPAKDCLWDVRLFVRDDVQPPMKSKR
ncbi:MAG: hypothetical protein DI536_34800 [Archangium gephyra]|uniref:Uncharacterized protein n=1 Tax=Archangium gephyra TaxID=48 RepID=A0A2W5ULP3_9BACT|nr:MAG: hypothetical protein DI536_34800 [Archangium gephyra]